MLLPRPLFALALSLPCAALSGSAASAEDWPQWRGPDGQGHANAKGLPLHFSETENVAWKTPIAGKGWSSPVVEGGAVWVTTSFEEPVSEEEKARRLVGNTNNQPLAVVGDLRLHAVGLSRSTGEILADIELLHVRDPEPIHTLNSFASPSPVIENGRLYCHFGSNGTACLDTKTKRVIWRNQELRVAHENGAGSTPILWKDFLIVNCDGSDLQYVVALEKKTGEIAWKTSRSGKMRENPQYRKSYGTPLVIDVEGKPQLISPGADWLYAYDPASGKELWKLSYEAQGFSIAPRPVIGHGMIYMCTSFMRSELLAVRYERDGAPISPAIAWRYGRQVPQMPSPVLVGDEIYFVSDSGGIATCLDARTGETRWQERLGGNFAASPLFADGKIWFFSREGAVTAIEPGPTFEKAGESKLDGAFMASAAAVDGAFYLRTDQALYRIEATNERGTKTARAE